MARGVRWFVSDRGGRVVIAQVPNLPLTAFVALWLAAHLVRAPEVRDALTFLAHAFLWTWGYLEVRCGASPIRRVFGAVALAWLVWRYWP